MYSSVEKIKLFLFFVTFVTIFFIKKAIFKIQMFLIVYTDYLRGIT